MEKRDMMDTDRIVLKGDTVLCLHLLQLIMQEVLARSESPNRGNKAHLAYFPVLAETLATLSPDSMDIGNKFITELAILE